MLSLHNDSALFCLIKPFPYEVASCNSLRALLYDSDTVIWDATLATLHFVQPIHCEFQKESR